MSPNTFFLIFAWVAWNYDHWKSRLWLPPPGSELRSWFAENISQEVPPGCGSYVPGHVSPLLLNFCSCFLIDSSARKRCLLFVQAFEKSPGAASHRQTSRVPGQRDWDRLVEDIRFAPFFCQWFDVKSENNGTEETSSLLPQFYRHSSLLLFPQCIFSFPGTLVRSYGKARWPFLLCSLSIRLSLRIVFS